MKIYNTALITALGHVRTLPKPRVKFNDKL